MSRTHIVTASSTVKQERRLPLIEGMSVKDLADIQIKQLTNHKASLEGWERISSDTYVFSIRVTFSSYIPSEQDVGHKLKIEVISLKTNSVALFKESEPVTYDSLVSLP